MNAPRPNLSQPEVRAQRGANANQFFTDFPEVKMKLLHLACIALVLPIEAVAGETTFVIGARPWNFDQRSRSNHLNMQMMGPDGSGQGFGGAGGYPGFPAVSNAYAIGNWLQVEMTLAEGAEGLIMIENHQTSLGDQQAVSDVMGEIIDTYQADDKNDGFSLEN
ncbi:MAG: hypothetical protein HUJ27_03185 [Rhodobacteraceae bacterium]|nr:hypothetical protein [Paracoccaceae bacterium]